MHVVDAPCLSRAPTFTAADRTMLIGLMRGMCLTNEDAVFKRMEKKYVLWRYRLGGQFGTQDTVRSAV